MGTTQKTKTEMDPIQQEFLTGTLLPFAKDIAGRAFTPYTGDRVAGLTDLQRAALSGYGGLSLPSELGEAAGIYRGMATQTPEQRAADIAQYTQQYTQNVIDPTLAALERQRGEREVGLEAGRGSAFGNTAYETRAGAELGAFDVGMARELGQLQTQGYQSALARAAQEDAQRMQAAGALAGTGMTGLQAQQSILGAQMGAGEAERALSQADLDAAYQSYLMEQQYPLQQFGVLSGAAGAFPAGIGTTTQKTGGLGPALSAAGSLAMGLGPMGAGLIGGAGGAGMLGSSSLGIANRAITSPLTFGLPAGTHQYDPYRFFNLGNKI
jgi:hypothetical protein